MLYVVPVEGNKFFHIFFFKWIQGIAKHTHYIKISTGKQYQYINVIYSLI